MNSEEDTVITVPALNLIKKKDMKNTKPLRRRYLFGKKLWLLCRSSLCIYNTLIEELMIESFMALLVGQQTFFFLPLDDQIISF